MNMWKYCPSTEKLSKTTGYYNYRLQFQRMSLLGTISWYLTAWSIEIAFFGCISVWPAARKLRTTKHGIMYWLMFHKDHMVACIMRRVTVTARWRTEESGNLVKYSWKGCSSIHTNTGLLARKDLPLVQEHQLACVHALVCTYTRKICKCPTYKYSDCDSHSWMGTETSFFCDTLMYRLCMIQIGI